MLATHVASAESMPRSVETVLSVMRKIGSGGGALDACLRLLVFIAHQPHARSPDGRREFYEALDKGGVMTQLLASFATAADGGEKASGAEAEAMSEDEVEEVGREGGQ